MERRQINLSDAFGSQALVYDGSHLFVVGMLENRQSSLDYSCSIRHRHAEFDLGPPTEALLTGPVGHFQWKAQSMQPRMHGLMYHAGGYLRIRELRIHRECELYHARALIGEIRAATRVALYANEREVTTKVSVVVRRHTRDELQYSLEPAEHLVGVYVGTRVDHNDRDAAGLRRPGCGFQHRRCLRLGRISGLSVKLDITATLAAVAFHRQNFFPLRLQSRPIAALGRAFDPRRDARNGVIAAIHGESELHLAAAAGALQFPGHLMSREGCVVA